VAGHISVRARFALPDEFRLSAGISSKLSQWRQSAELKGLTASDQLPIVELPVEDRLEFTTCAVAHNSTNSVAIGSNQSRSSVVQLVRVWDPQQRKSSAMRVLHRLRMPEGCVSLSWLDEKLLCGSAQGSIFLYRCPMLSSASSGALKSGGGLSPDGFLEQTYVHTHLKDATMGAAAQPPPGQWGLSTRIHKVALNPVSKAAFLSVENSTVHLWSCEQSARPLHSEKASSGVLFAACWNPHSGTELVVGGLRKHIKLYDVRLLGQAASKSVVRP
jgi:WD40 repeat protein